MNARHLPGGLAASFARVAPILFLALTPFVVFPLDLLRVGLIDPGGDDAAMYLPYLHYSAEALFRGEVLWTPDTFLGQPLLQQPEFAVYYPLRLFIPLFDPARGYTIYVVLHFVIAQLATYALLRGLGASRPAATLAGVAFAYCGFMRGHQMGASYIAAAAYSPLFLLFMHRFARRGRPSDALGAALCFGVHALTGAFQLMVYLAAASAVLAAVVSLVERSPRYLLGSLLVMVPGGLVASLQALPSLELTRTLALAERTSYAHNTLNSWHPLLLPATYVSDSFDESEMYAHNGAVVMALAFVAAVTSFRLRRRNPFVLGFTAVMLLGVVLAYGRHVEGLARLLHLLPLVKVFRHPVRHLFEVGLATAALSAFALDAFVIRRRRLPGGLLPWAIGLPAAMAAGVLIPKAIAGAIAVEERVAEYLTSLPATQAIWPAAAALVAVAATALRRRRLAVVAGVGLLLAATGERVYVSRQDDHGLRRDRAAELDRAMSLAPPPGRTRRIITVLQDDARGLDTLFGNLALLVPGVQRLTGYATTAPQDLVRLLELREQGEADPLAPLIWSRFPSILGVTHLIMPLARCDPFAVTIDAEAMRSGRCSPGKGGDVPFDAPVSCLAKVQDEAPTYTLRGVARGARGDSLYLTLGKNAETIERGVTTAGPDRPVPLAWRIVPSRVPRAGHLLVGRPAEQQGEVSLGALRIERTTEVGGRPRAEAAMFFGVPPAEGWVGAGVFYARGTYTFTADADLYEMPYFLPRRPITITVTRLAGPPFGFAVRALSQDRHNAWDLARELLAPAEDIAIAGRVSTSFDVGPDETVLPLGFMPDIRGKGSPRARITAESACGLRRYRRDRRLWDGLWLYENRGALPRAYAATRLIPADGAEVIRPILRDRASFVPGRDVVVPVRSGLPERVAPARIVGAAFEAEEVLLDVAADDGPGFVVVNDRMDPHWRASIDGEPTELYRVNGVVRGVLVPKGRHRVRHWFSVPPSVPAGVVAGLAGILCALFFLPRLWRRLP